MRLNVSKYQEIMRQQDISKNDIERMTGITEATLDWIFENEHLEISTLERMAAVVQCSTSVIALPDHNNKENVIEWTRDSKTATLSLTQGRTITRVLKLAESRPEECKIIAENKDGSICAIVPVTWIKIHAPKEYTDEERKELVARLNGNNFHAL